MKVLKYFLKPVVIFSGKHEDIDQAIAYLEKYEVGVEVMKQ